MHRFIIDIGQSAEIFRQHLRETLSRYHSAEREEHVRYVVHELSEQIILQMDGSEDESFLRVISIIDPLKISHLPVMQTPEFMNAFNQYASELVTCIHRMINPRSIPCEYFLEAVAYDYVLVVQNLTPTGEPYV